MNKKTTEKERQNQKTIDQIIKENTLYPEVDDMRNKTSHMVTKFDLPKDEEDETPSKHSEYVSVHIAQTKEKSFTREKSSTRPEEEHFHHEKFLFSEATNRVVNRPEPPK